MAINWDDYIGRPPDIGSLTSNRLGGSIDAYQGSLYGTGEAVAGALGLQVAQDWLRKQREENELEANAAAYRAKQLGGIDSYKDVHGVGDALNYLGGLGAQALPYMAELLVPGAAVRYVSNGLKSAIALGRAAGATEDVVAAGRAAERTLAAKQMAAGTAASLPSSTGDILGNQREQLRSQGLDDSKVDLLSAATGAVPYALLNGTLGLGRAASTVGLAKRGVVGLDGALDAMQGFRGGLARTGATVARTGVEEGLSEAGQEVINQRFGRMAVDPTQVIDDPQAIERYKEAFVGGAALGGAFGTVGGHRRSDGFYEKQEDERRAALRAAEIERAAQADLLARQDAAEKARQEDLRAQGDLLYGSAPSPDIGLFSPLSARPGTGLAPDVLDEMRGQRDAARTAMAYAAKVGDHKQFYQAQSAFNELSTILEPYDAQANRDAAQASEGQLGLRLTMPERPNTPIYSAPNETDPSLVLERKPEGDVGAFRLRGQTQADLDALNASEAAPSEPAVEPQFTTDRLNQKGTTGEMLEPQYRSPKAQQIWGVANALAHDGFMDDGDLVRIDVLLTNSRFGDAAKIVTGKLKEKQSVDKMHVTASKVAASDPASTPQAEPQLSPGFALLEQYGNPAKPMADRYRTGLFAYLGLSADGHLNGSPVDLQTAAKIAGLGSKNALAQGLNRAGFTPEVRSMALQLFAPPAVHLAPSTQETEGERYTESPERSDRTPQTSDEISAGFTTGVQDLFDTTGSEESSGGTGMRVVSTPGTSVAFAPHEREIDVVNTLHAAMRGGLLTPGQRRAVASIVGEPGEHPVRTLSDTAAKTVGRAARAWVKSGHISVDGEPVPIDAGLLTALKENTTATATVNTQEARKANVASAEQQKRDEGAALERARVQVDQVLREAAQRSWDGDRPSWSPPWSELDENTQQQHIANTEKLSDFLFENEGNYDEQRYTSDTEALRDSTRRADAGSAKPQDAGDVQAGRGVSQPAAQAHPQRDETSGVRLEIQQPTETNGRGAQKLTPAEENELQVHQELIDKYDALIACLRGRKIRR